MMSREAWLRLTLPVVVSAAMVGGVGIVASGRGLWALLSGGIQTLIALSTTAPLTTACLYVFAYALMVAICLPVGPAMSMAGGVLLGMAMGTACATLGIAAGSIGFFLVARTAFGFALGRGRGEMLERLRPRLERDGFLALLAMRIVPIMPSSLLGLASAAVGMRLLPFSGATVFGVLPATLMFASAGAGVGQAFVNRAAPSLDPVLRPGVLIPLLGVSILVFLPVLLRRRRRDPRRGTI